jgi:precorrin-6Y C5,15-methyltransferase (decarboxylating)
MPPASPLAAHTAAPRRWLSIVGIGEDGVEGLAPVARGLIADAEVVFGGKRHLALAGSLIRGTMWPWPSPFDEAVSKVVERRGRPVCVLASGIRSFMASVALARHVDPNEMLVVPGPSSFSLAARAAGLVAAGNHAAVAARPSARPDPPASASRRANHGSDTRRRGAAGGGRAAE